MDFDTVVVGAGVVGLAVGRALALSDREVLVLESEAAIGTATSSRNSGVIHAGIYYPRGSLKARLCVRGKQLLYEYCAKRQVAHRRCGKLIVATSAREIPILEGYRAAAQANGAGSLEWLEATDVIALEPGVRCVAAIHSRSTGIIDVHELMQSYLGDLEAAGGQIALRTAFGAAALAPGGFRVRLNDECSTEFRVREIVNSAGLDAVRVARNIEGLTAEATPRAYYARGHYYSLSGIAPFSRLVYPVAEAAGLGTHVTLDLGGVVRFGPDVEWVDAIDYRFTQDRSDEFAAAIRKYYPGLDRSRLRPDYTGIRPKISGPGDPAADFRIDGPERHGVAGLVNLFGIESPGLTASMAIAEEVVGRLRQ